MCVEFVYLLWQCILINPVKSWADCQNSTTSVITAVLNLLFYCVEQYRKNSKQNEMHERRMQWENNNNKIYAAQPASGLKNELNESRE